MRLSSENKAGRDLLECLLFVGWITVASAWPFPTVLLACNGHAELCGRSYGNITHIGAHDSFASSSDPLALARTQTIDITAQLNMGVRMLQAQSHMFLGEIHLCHTSCFLFNGGTVVNYLKKVKAFLDSNPNEVVTLLFTNPEGLSANKLWLPVFQASGIVPYAYVPPRQPMLWSEWPTLDQMIDSGKRFVIFFDYPGAAGDTLPFVSYEFFNIWETPYDSIDPTFPCSVNRGSSPPAINDHMYMVNHYLCQRLVKEDILIPNHNAAPVTNSVVSIISSANKCAPLSNGRAPNFVLLDWVNEGQVVQAINLLNGLLPSAIDDLKMTRFRNFVELAIPSWIGEWLWLLLG